MIIPSFHTEQLKEGEGDVIWTIYLKNGDTLRLHHTVKITRIPVVTLTENDYPMATVDDLNALLDTLAHEADRKAVYILQLPAVTYEGGLTVKNFCCERGRHDVHRHGDDRDARHSPLKHHERPLCGRRYGHRPFRERGSVPAPLHV